METRRMCPHCRAFITTKDRTCPYCNEAVAPPARRGGSEPILGGLIPHAGFNTVIILIINLGFYVATAIASMKAGGDAWNFDGRVVFDLGAMYSPAVAAGQWWRLVTAGFLHGGLIHILMNSWVLFDLGAQVEDVYGSSRMLVIYFVSTVTGYYASYLMWRPVPSVGASAALCGLIGAMIALGMRHRSGFGAAIRAVYIRWLIYIMLFSLFGGIDMAAHAGGAVGGFAVGYMAGDVGAEGSPAERMWRVAAWLAILTTVVCFLKMYLWFSHSA